MFLTRLTLENLKSIEHLELPMRDSDGDPRKWSFVLGNNGTGKSTILKAVALGFAGSEALPELLGQPSDWVRWGADEARIHAEFQTADGQERELALVLGKNDTLRDTYSRNEAGLEMLDDALTHTNRNYFVVGYGVSRHPSSTETFSKASPGFSHPRSRNVATLFSSDAPLISLESWAMDLDYRREGGIDIVAGALNDLLPDIEFAGIDKERRELMFDTPDGVTPFRLLSDGYRNVAAWTGDLLAQITEVFDDLERPLEARGLLLVDEIGLHLHPTWQRRLVRFISERLPNFQVVTTTHSPITVHQAGEGELFFLRREEPEAPATLHPYEGAPRNLMLHQLLTSPVFELTSLDSEPVENMKTEYRTLRDQDNLSDSEQERFDELKTELADLPDWSDTTQESQDLKALLSEIQAELDGR